MATIILSDETIFFRKEEIPRIPYINDILSDPEELPTIPIMSVSSRGLHLVKEFLELQTAVGKEFKYKTSRCVRYGEVQINNPSYMCDEDPWEGTIPEYADRIKTLTIDDCIDLFITADFLACYDLRYVAAYKLIPCILNTRSADISSKLSGSQLGILSQIYLETSPNIEIKGD